MKLKILPLIALPFVLVSSVLFSFAQEEGMLREQSAQEEKTVEIAVNLASNALPRVSPGAREYYLKVTTRDILTENDCRILIDLNESLALIQKYYKEKKYERARDLLKIIFADLEKTKTSAEARINEKLLAGASMADFKGLFEEVRVRRYPATCPYRHLHDIENDVKVFQRDVEEAIFKQEAKLVDKQREEKMRSHIEKALGLLEQKRFREGGRELKMALELCQDYQTRKILLQRIREVDLAIHQEKREQVLEKKKRK